MIIPHCAHICYDVGLKVHPQLSRKHYVHRASRALCSISPNGNKASQISARPSWVCKKEPALLMPPKKGQKPIIPRKKRRNKNKKTKKTKKNRRKRNKKKKGKKNKKNKGPK